MFNYDIFLAHAKHEQEKEDIIWQILEAIQSGKENISIKLDGNFSKKDINYIKKEVYRKLR